MTSSNTPLSPTYLTHLAKHLFESLKNVDCQTCFFVPGGGKRVISRFFLTHPDYLEAILGKRLDKMIFILINPDNLLDATPTAYIQLLAGGLTAAMTHRQLAISSDNRDNPLEMLKKNLTTITELGYTIIYILNDFEYTLNLPSSIYLNLENIMSVNKSRITYLFLCSMNLLDEETFLKLHNLKYAVSQHVCYHRLLPLSEIDYVLDQFLKKLTAPNASGIRSLLTRLCGGHPQLLKYACSIVETADPIVSENLQTLEQYLTKNSQLHIICADIWQALNDQEKDIVRQVLKNHTMLNGSHKQADYLLKTGILEPLEDGKYQLFGQLFTEYVLGQIPAQALSFDSKTNQLFLGLTNCTEFFTVQEFNVLSHLVKNAEKVVDREAIAKVLWGNDSYDKYSDWSIDKTISVIRKKLDDLGFPIHQLITLKKRGFRLSLAS